jgi:hypothetical protein
MPPVVQRPGRTKKLHGTSVYVRIRPHATSGGHAEDGDSVYKRLHGWTESSVTLKDGHGLSEYTFPTQVLGPDVAQHEAYDAMLPDLVEAFTKHEGQNVLFFAYGQTGTGKTHTMFGPDNCLKDGQLNEDWGVFPRVVHHVFEKMEARKQHTRFVLTASAIEFYLGGCFDLLAGHNAINIGFDRSPRGHTMRRIESTLELVHFLEEVRANRTARSTMMNEQSEDHTGSSRSHCALILTLLQLDEESQETCRTMFTLVDLAGAERPDKTGAPRMSAFEALMSIFRGGEPSVGAQGVIINYELHEIRSAVASATQLHRQGRVYVPPKQLSSAAVQFMGACLDGTVLLGMVVCVSQALRNGWETWFSLNYGEALAQLRVPTIAQKAVVVKKAVKKANQDMEDAVVLLAKTPKTGSPSSKYYKDREISVRETAHRVELMEILIGKPSRKKES